MSNDISKSRGVFISATDTGVGKTTVAAGVLRSFSRFRAMRYWKPVQTGADCDTTEVARLVGLPVEGFEKPQYHFSEPLSPHLAASLAGGEICVETLTRRFHEISQTQFMIVEGAGGLLVPLNTTSYIVDLPRIWRLPVILVAEDRLGAINQTLLSIEACRVRGVEVAGVIWNLATKDFGNAETVANLSRVKSLVRLFKSSPDKVLTQIDEANCLNEMFLRSL